MRRVALAVVLASLVVLAGCGGTGGTPTPTSTDTPEDTPTPSPTATPTSTPDELGSIDYPEGASADGFTDAQAIASSQRGLLNETSYTLVYDAEVVSGPREGERSNFRTTYTPDRALTTIETVQRGATSNSQIWSGPDATAFRSSNESRTRYSYYDRNASIVTGFYRFYGLQLAQNVPTQFLAAFNYEAVDAEQRDGHTYIEYESTGVASDGSARNFASADLRVVLRDDGLVTSIQGSVVEDTEQGESTREVSYEISDVGSTTVERPTWLDESVPTVTTELVDGGSTIAITNEGDTAIDNGTLAVQASVTAQAPFDGLDPGETIYVTINRSNGQTNLAVHDQQPGPETGDLDFTTVRRVVVSLQGGPFQYTLRADPGAE